MNYRQAARRYAVDPKTAHPASIQTAVLMSTPTFARPSRVVVERLSPTGDWWFSSSRPFTELQGARADAEDLARRTAKDRLSIVRIQRHDPGHDEPETVAVFVGEQGVVREATALDAFTLDEFCRLMAGAAAS